MSIKYKTKINIHIPYSYQENKEIVANETELSRSAKVKFDIDKIQADVQRQLNLHSKDLVYELQASLRKRLKQLKGVKIK